MKNTLTKMSAVAVLALCACSASAATEAEMQAAKAEGQNLGVAQASSNPTSAAAGTFNTTSGVGGYASLGEPANGGIAGAKGANTYPLTVDCNVSRTKYVGGIGVKYGTCALDAGANVTAIPFSICTRSQSGAICGTSDWSSYQSVSKGGSKTFAGGKVVIKVTSCSYNTCQVSLTDNDQASGTGASLNEQGQQRADEEGADGLAGQQASVYGGSLYHGALQGAGNQVECYNTNVNQSLEADGTVKTCDGQQTASFDPGCKTVTECLQQDTTTRTWSETCEAEVPLTTKTCTTKTPTLDCDGARLKQTVGCSNVLSVSCVANSNAVAQVPVSTSGWWCDSCDEAADATWWRNVFASAATQAGNTVVYSTRSIPQVCGQVYDPDYGSYISCTGGGTEYLATASGGAPVTMWLNSINIGTGYTYIFHPNGSYGRMSIDGKIAGKNGKPWIYFKAMADCPGKVWTPATKDHPGHWACPSTISGCPAGSTVSVINGKYTCLGEFTFDCTDTWADGCVSYK